MTGLRERVRVRLARRRMEGSGYRFVPSGPCLCGEPGGEAAREREELGRSLTLVLCRRCGLGRLSPRLAAEDLPRYYAGDYRTTIRGTSRIDQAYFDRGVRRGERLVEHLRRQRATPTPGTPVLELGAGAGGILEAFRRLGHPVAGSDLDPDCVAFARRQGLDVIDGEALPPSREPAGLIVLSHLVEHLPDPAVTLAGLRPHVSAETILYVEVPGLRATKPGDAVPQIPHLFYYDLDTLTWLLARSGWERTSGDEHVRATFRLGEATERPPEGNFERNRAFLSTVA